MWRLSWRQFARLERRLLRRRPLLLGHWRLGWGGNYWWKPAGKPGKPPLGSDFAAPTGPGASPGALAALFVNIQELSRGFLPEGSGIRRHLKIILNLLERKLFLRWTDLIYHQKRDALLQIFIYNLLFSVSNRKMILSINNSFRKHDCAKFPILRYPCTADFKIVLYSLIFLTLKIYTA